MVVSRLVWEELRVGDLVCLPHGNAFSYSVENIFGWRRPLLVVGKKYRRKWDRIWATSELKQVVIVRSLAHPDREREFFLYQLAPPPPLEAFYARQRERWVAALARYKKPSWCTFLAPDSGPYYKPRRTSEQVQEDKKEKQWRKALLKLEKEG